MKQFTKTIAAVLTIATMTTAGILTQNYQHLTTTAGMTTTGAVAHLQQFQYLTAEESRTVSTLTTAGADAKTALTVIEKSRTEAKKAAKAAKGGK